MWQLLMVFIVANCGFFVISYRSKAKTKCNHWMPDSWRDSWTTFI